MGGYDFNLLPARTRAPEDNILYKDPPGWRWMGYQELRDWRNAARASYVVRPYHAHQGSLEQIFTPVGGNLSTATAAMIRHMWRPQR